MCTVSITDFLKPMNVPTSTYLIHANCILKPRVILIVIMTSVGTFNDMLEQFINELEQTFPEEKAFKKYHVSLDIMRAANPRKCVDTFMKSAGKYSAQIMQKDDSFFSNFNDLPIHKHWNDNLSDGTKSAIWQYLQTLNILGMTITNIPADMLSMVEGVAAKCAEGMQGGGAMDEKSLMSGMTSLFSSMTGLLGEKN